MPAPLHRCLAVWLVATAAASGLVAVLLPVALAPATRFDELLTRACAVAGALVATWLWVVATAVAVEARHGRARVPAPAAVRRVLLAACGVAVVAGLATPAGAAPRGDVPQTAVTVVADALAGLPLPDRPHGHAAAPRVTVRPGDTLWGLAEHHLGSGDRWPEIYALNRAVVGADPDVIQPAQRLRLPAKEK
ncbi:LysM peptidoglycan-binding domain-containing protein [Nocardioides pyridinolyticus]